MRIGFDFRMGGSMNAGIGRYAFELLQALLQVNSSHEFYVFYNKQNTNSEDLKVLVKLGAQLIEANFRHYSWQEQILFSRLLNKLKLDLVHFPNFNVPVFYRGKYVVTIHDMVHHIISGHKKSRYYKFLAYKYIIKQAAKRAQKIITITESSKLDITNLLSESPQKIKVIYEAPSRFESKPAEFGTVKSQFFLTRPYLLFVGTLERKKNLMNLAKGFDICLEQYQYDLDLVVSGKIDEHYPEIKDQMLQIKHRDNLVFTSYVTDEIQVALYKNAFAFITASLYEGFGLPGLEAMHYGLPVLAANTSVFNEVYDNAAIFFDATNPADIAEKINLLVGDSKFYTEMQKRGHARSQYFEWRKTAQETLSLYQEVFNTPQQSLNQPSKRQLIYEPEQE